MNHKQSTRPADKRTVKGRGVLVGYVDVKIQKFSNFITLSKTKYNVLPIIKKRKLVKTSHLIEGVNFCAKRRRIWRQNTSQTRQNRFLTCIRSTCARPQKKCWLSGTIAATVLLTTFKSMNTYMTIGLLTPHDNNFSDLFIILQLLANVKSVWICNKIKNSP